MEYHYEIAYNEDGVQVESLRVSKVVCECNFSFIAKQVHLFIFCLISNKQRTFSGTDSSKLRIKVLECSMRVIWSINNVLKNFFF